MRRRCLLGPLRLRTCTHFGRYVFVWSTRRAADVCFGYEAVKGWLLLTAPEMAQYLTGRDRQGSRSTLDGNPLLCESLNSTRMVKFGDSSFLPLFLRQYLFHTTQSHPTSHLNSLFCNPTCSTAVHRTAPTDHNIGHQSSHRYTHIQFSDTLLFNYSTQYPLRDPS
jgi:hypothetical protein